MPTLGIVELIALGIFALVIFGAWHFIKSLILVYVKAQKSNNP